MTINAKNDYAQIRPKELNVEDGVARKNAYLKRNILPLLSALGKNDAILEIGPGTGALAALISQQGFKNYSALEVCKEYAEELQKKNHICHHGDAVVEMLESHYQAGSVRLIVAIDVLEHLPMAEALDLLAVCKRKLASGGQVVFQVPNSSGLFGDNTFVADPTHQTPYNEIRLQAVLEGAGFLGVDVMPVRLPPSLANSVRSLFQKVIFAAVRFLTKAVGSTPVRHMTHLIIGTGRA